MGSALPVPHNPGTAARYICGLHRGGVVRLEKFPERGELCSASTALLLCVAACCLCGLHRGGNVRPEGSPLASAAALRISSTVAELCACPTFWRSGPCLLPGNPGLPAFCTVLQNASVLASGGDDRRIAIWDLDRAPSEPPAGLAASPTSSPHKQRHPPQLLMQHVGHRAPVSAQQKRSHHCHKHIPPLQLLMQRVGTSAGESTTQSRLAELVFRLWTTTSIWLCSVTVRPQHDGILPRECRLFGITQDPCTRCLQ